MYKIYGLAVVFMLVGCASQGGEQIHSRPPVQPAAEGDNSDPSAQSRLSDKQKCPKNSKLVDGKCTLSVESDE